MARSILSQILVGLSVAGILAGLVYLGVVDARRSRLFGRGEVAPPFELERYQGGQVKLSELRGRVVMLDFWATWCPPCVAEMPSLLKLAKEYEAKGLTFIAASRDEPHEARAVVQQFIARRAPELGPFVAFAPDPVAERYRVATLPTLYFIDREGRILSSHRGAASESRLRQWIEAALRQP